MVPYRDNPGPKCAEGPYSIKIDIFLLREPLYTLYTPLIHHTHPHTYGIINDNLMVIEARSWTPNFEGQTLCMFILMYGWTLYYILKLQIHFCVNYLSGFDTPPTIIFTYFRPPKLHLFSTPKKIRLRRSNGPVPGRYMAEMCRGPLFH